MALYLSKTRRHIMNIFKTERLQFRKKLHCFYCIVDLTRWPDFCFILFMPLDLNVLQLNFVLLKFSI